MLFGFAMFHLYVIVMILHNEVTHLRAFPPFWSGGVTLYISIIELVEFYNTICLSKAPIGEYMDSITRLDMGRSGEYSVEKSANSMSFRTLSLGICLLFVA